MSRLKHFARSVISSYGLLGASAIYSYISVRLAVAYLDTNQLGLWANTAKVGDYILLIELGMSSSIARILIDHKDDRSTGRYGAAIRTGLLIGLTQGMIAFVVGLGVAWFLPGVLKTGTSLVTEFRWLLLGQVILTVGLFATRLFSQILFAWQRLDFYNWIQAGCLMIGLGVLWAGFAGRLGVFSYIAGSAATLVCVAVLNSWSCLRLGFWPASGEWGRLSWAHFKEMFSYGTDLFFIGIGTQLIGSSQVFLVTRQLGEHGEKSAFLWYAATKGFTLVAQLAWRIMYNAMPAFAEMSVRGEKTRMWDRYRALFVGVNVLIAICAVVFAACNRTFVDLWTDGKYSWSGLDDLLLGIWLVFSTQQICHNGLVINLKQVGTLKYIFVLEGCMFVGLAYAILPVWGITGMLACSVGATILCTWLCGAWRIAGLLGGWRAPLWDWQKPLLLVVAAMLPVWWLVQRELPSSPSWIALILKASLLGAVGSLAAVWFAIPSDIAREFVQRLPKSVRVPTLAVLVRLRGKAYAQL